MGKHKKRRNQPSQSKGRQETNRVPGHVIPPNSAATTHHLLKQSWFWTAVLFFIALGFPIVVPNGDSPTVVYFGWFLWGLPVTLFLLGLCQQLKTTQWVKIVLMLTGACIFLWLAHRNIIERLRPSFVYISPSVLLNGDTWDFIANHRGSKSSFNVQVLFIDDDRKDYARTQTSFTPADTSTATRRFGRCLK
jgi:hypothetical protein